jgi:hypothetical protein
VAAGGDQLAQGTVRSASRVIVQACRRPGASRTADLTISHVDLQRSAKARLAARQIAKADRIHAVSAPAHAAATRLPSGRTRYRQLPDYEADLEQLAAQHPGVVKRIVLPDPTLIGRRVIGVEIARDVHARDGRPVMFLNGLHHAREWPAGEMAMEWAIDLVKRLDGGDAQVRGLLSKARVVVVPVVNPDGFYLSRTVRGAFEFKRKNCRIVADERPAAGQCEADANAELGTDPNRNYGGFWGGPGASLDPSADDYRGSGPFSEPEPRNLHALIGSRQVTVALALHTYGNDLLRPPSLSSQSPPDATDLKRLGDLIARPAHLTDEPAYQLYDTTGAMEDWSYWSTGGLAFTAELGPDPTEDTDEASLVAFHPPFREVASWYPGLRTGFDHALAWAAAPRHHSVIRGRGPRGATITLSQTFRTMTSPVLGPDGIAGAPLSFPDGRRSSLRIPASGRFTLHANPSTRPVAEGSPGRAPEGPTTAPVPIVSPGTTTSFPYTQPDASDAPASARADFPFTIAPGDDDAQIHARITWADPANDWDLYVFRIEADGTETLVGTSGQGHTTWEQADVGAGTYNGRLPAGHYVVRVVDYATTDKAFTGEITFTGPRPAVAATPERWTLRCAVHGRTRATHEVFVARGHAVSVGDAC